MFKIATAFILVAVIAAVFGWGDAAIFPQTDAAQVWAARMVALVALLGALGCFVNGFYRARHRTAHQFEPGAVKPDDEQPRRDAGTRS